MASNKPHQPEPLPAARKGIHIPWLVCTRCGLVYLRNAATVAAQRKACPGVE